jgi:hypothetical protein
MGGLLFTFRVVTAVMLLSRGPEKKNANIPLAVFVCDAICVEYGG